jgi:hypothetical protein
VRRSSKDDYSLGINSTNLTVTHELLGKQQRMPDGDSGKVKFTVKHDAISYKFVFSDGNIENAPSVFESADLQNRHYRHIVIASAESWSNIQYNR